jgi:putative phosphoribosyl transferase
MAQADTKGKLRVVSTGDKPFDNRIEAGQLLAAELLNYRDSKPVVLGIPRGGIIIAEKIARSLDADLDIILTHKLGAPQNPELAIGAVSEDGRHFIAHDIAFGAGANTQYIEQEKARQLQELERKVKLYRAVLPKVSLEDRTVIATDDGVATGSTMEAALWALRRERPQTIVLALPVGPPDTVARLSNIADETVCLRTPRYFQALGRFYKSFPQVEDDELLKILREEIERRPVLRSESEGGNAK